MDIKETLKAPMEYNQKLRALAAAAENSLEPLPLGKDARMFMEQRALDDMGEGLAPWRPRYILPDYRLLFEKGCKHLELQPPRDLDDALNLLLIFYHYVPSITSYPVYLGCLDQMLEPYAQGVEKKQLERKLELFLRAVDRMFPDNFVHYNLAADGAVTRALLAMEDKLGQAVPNASLFVDENTPDELLELAANVALNTSKPYLINADYAAELYGGNCGVASCYNLLPVGGGAYTLVRMNLAQLVRHNPVNSQQLLDELLPRAVAAQAELAAQRVKFLVEESNFFSSSFLVDEGFLQRQRFTAMAGIVGLAEAVAFVSEQDGKKLVLGKDREATELAENIVRRLNELLEQHEVPWCEVSGNRALLHAQVGMPGDEDTTPGSRIAVDDIPPLLDQLNTEVPLHQYFPAGTSSIIVFDSSVRNNPGALVKIIRGALSEGATVVSLNASDSDVVRITGYLVRRKDLDGSGWHSVDGTSPEAVERLGLLRRRANR